MELILTPEVVKWARTRAGLSVEDLVKKFPKYRDWENGTGDITLPQLKKLAKATYLSEGVLLMSEAPEDDFMLEEFRVAKNRKTAKPSVHLIDVLKLCRKKQDWYRADSLYGGYYELPFVGAATEDSDPGLVASEICSTIGFNRGDRIQPFQEGRYLEMLVEKVEKAEILVMISSSVVGSPRRKLDVAEFRGFTLSDKFAPLIFINGSDHVPAQIFTLCHELAHVWLGKSAFCANSMEKPPKRGMEAFCNEVAAEILVPVSDLRSIHIKKDESVNHLLELLRNRYKASDMNLLLRLREINAITDSMFRKLYAIEAEKSARRRKRAKEGIKGGEMTYQTLVKASSRKFLDRLIPDTLSGGTFYTEAFRLLGVWGTNTVDGLAREMGIK